MARSANVKPGRMQRSGANIKRAKVFAATGANAGSGYRLRPESTASAQRNFNQAE
jgi:hypothetical protein